MSRVFIKKSHFHAHKFTKFCSKYKLVAQEQYHYKNIPLSHTNTATTIISKYCTEFQLKNNFINTEVSPYNIKSNRWTVLEEH